MNNIHVLTQPDLNDFFPYLNQHLAQNGKDGDALFQPVSRKVDAFPVEKESSFAQGLTIPVGQPQWRRAWFVRDVNGQIIAHIDLRALPEAYTEHRCLLGMGMLKNHRRKGLGAQMLEHVTAWSRVNTEIEQIDLSVLSSNIPARSFYLKAGFLAMGEIPDKFRIDGSSEGDFLMSKNIREG